MCWPIHLYVMHSQVHLCLSLVIPANLSPQFCICANLPESLALQIWVGTFQPKKSITFQHEFASYPLRKSHSHTGRSCICVLYSKEAIIICTMCLMPNKIMLCYVMLLADAIRTRQSLVFWPVYCILGKQ